EFVMSTVPTELWPGARPVTFSSAVPACVLVTETTPALIRLPLLVELDWKFAPLNAVSATATSSAPPANRNRRGIDAAIDLMRAPAPRANRPAPGRQAAGTAARRR